MVTERCHLTIGADAGEQCGLYQRRPRRGSTQSLEFMKSPDSLYRKHIRVVAKVVVVALAVTYLGTFAVKSRQAENYCVSRLIPRHETSWFTSSRVSLWTLRAYCVYPGHADVPPLVMPIEMVEAMSIRVAYPVP